jgi:hypothetical protein
LPILLAAKTAYRDLLHVVLAMPVLSGCALLIVLAASVVDISVPQKLWATPVLGDILSLLMDIARGFLLTPIMIAAHRYILLAEVTPGYVLDPGASEFQLFFGWLAALSVLSALSTGVYSFVLAAGVGLVISSAVFIIGAIVLVAVTFRLSILFPAIAVGAPGATAKNAWADSERHGLRIFLIFLVGSVPLMAVVLFELLALGSGVQDRGSKLSVGNMILGSPIQTGFVILYVAIASRLFQTLGRRLIGQPDTTQT